MKPKEKALELFYKFNKITSKEFNSDTLHSATSAKECALICINEIIDQYPRPVMWYESIKLELEKL